MSEAFRGIAPIVCHGRVASALAPDSNRAAWIPAGEDGYPGWRQRVRLAQSRAHCLGKQYSPPILLGMGTLTEPEQADQALQAGATFLVSPHTESDLARSMTATGLLTMMGALTPSEVMMAKRLGSDVIKLFPGSLTSPACVKALKGPFTDLRIMPTGAVCVDNISEWLSVGVFAVGTARELCPTQLVTGGCFDEIVDTCSTIHVCPSTVPCLKMLRDRSDTITHLCG